MSNLVHANEIQAQIKVVQEIVRSVMKEDEHYGIIPGTKKFTLFQTGAQKLLATFRLGSEPEVVNVDETPFSVSYRVRVRLFNIADGNTVGYGMGECSSLEEKYAWRKAATSKEWENAPEQHRRIKYGQGQYGEYEIQQVRTNYKDVSNTILKMATKRALIQATLTATAAGDIFTQDLEEMEPLTREAVLGADPVTGEVTPKQKQSKNKPIASIEEIKNAVDALTYRTRAGELKNLLCMEEHRGNRVVLTIMGNTYSHSNLLKQMGFKYHKPEGAKFGETYMDVTEMVKKSTPAPQSAQNLLNANFTQLKTRVEMYGFEISEPVPSANGSLWVQATPLDAHGDTESLTKEGFILHNHKWVMNVTQIAA